MFIKGGSDQKPDAVFVKIRTYSHYSLSQQVGVSKMCLFKILAKPLKNTCEKVFVFLKEWQGEILLKVNFLKRWFKGFC